MKSLNESWNKVGVGIEGGVKDWEKSRMGELEKGKESERISEWNLTFFFKGAGVEKLPTWDCDVLRQELRVLSEERITR